jgi:hypothetical protein
MNILMLLIISVFFGFPMLLLLIYWCSLKNEAFGDGIALLCLLVSRPFIVVQDKLKEYHPEPTKAEDEKSDTVETARRKANDIVGDMIGAFVGSIIIAADTYLAVVFNSALFKTHEVVLSSGIFSWCAGLLWVATPAMFGILTGECARIVKSSGIFPNLHTAARWIIGTISFLLMCLSIFLIMYAYAYRGVKVFDPTNTFQIAQMGEGILTLLGLLIGAASIPGLIAVINGISTFLASFSFALLVVCQITTSCLEAYCLFLTGGEISPFLSVEKPIRVIVQEFQFSARRSKRQLQTAHTNEEPVSALPSPAPFAGRKRDEFPIIDNGKTGFHERANWALDVLDEKAPHRLQELVEYLPKIEYDSSLTDGNSWRAYSDGRFGYDLSDDDTALFVLAHETGHNIQSLQNNDSSEDAANRYAHEVMVELERA